LTSSKKWEQGDYFTQILLFKGVGFYLPVGISLNNFGGNLSMKRFFTALLVSVCGFAFAQSGEITVVSRESGSGTRSAFIELTKVEENKRDMTTNEAIVANKTDVVIATVAGNPNAIGYISMGSVSNRIKAVSIDGVAANTNNVKNGTYKLARPFNIAYTNAPNERAQDFINYIISAEGQAIIGKSYIAVVDSPKKFSSKMPRGRIVVAGSSSVTPVMELLVEGYKKINSNLNIEIQLSDSSTGIQAAINGSCDIGMASRALKTAELEKLTPLKIAIDGIAVIVNTSNKTTGLSLEEVKDIFTGKRTRW
jgi:phosphate transport system substrate-binding protein